MSRIDEEAGRVSGGTMDDGELPELASERELVGRLSDQDGETSLRVTA